MPAKNVIKKYVEGGVYHAYNRGINKQKIFLDNRDYATFLFFLKLYLSNPDDIKFDDPQRRKYLNRRNFYEDIDLLSYCLLPNHLHLHLRQKDNMSIAAFMKCLGTNYSMYFNDRYKRVGTVFQGPYKAVLINDDSYNLHLSRYIHMNPLKSAKGLSLGNLSSYEWSSYADYLGRKDTKWVKPKLILEYFEENKGSDMIAKDSYQDFVENFYSDSGQILGNFTLEEA